MVVRGARVLFELQLKSHGSTYPLKRVLGLIASWWNEYDSIEIILSVDGELVKEKLAFWLRIS